MGYEVMGKGETVREFDSVKGQGKKREGPRGVDWSPDVHVHGEKDGK